MLVLLMAGCDGKTDPVQPVESSKAPAVTTTQDTETKNVYVFTAGGVQVKVDAELGSVLDSLGTYAYHEETSCAFEGIDKFYDFGSYEIDTYPDGDKDYVSMIIIRDDLVSTTEGISLYMTKDDMIRVYGSDYTENGNLYSYDGGNMTLDFIIKEGEIVSIQYCSKVLK